MDTDSFSRQSHQIAWPDGFFLYFDCLDPYIGTLDISPNKAVINQSISSMRPIRRPVLRSPWVRTLGPDITIQHCYYITNITNIYISFIVLLLLYRLLSTSPPLWQQNRTKEQKESELDFGASRTQRSSICHFRVPTNLKFCRYLVYGAPPSCHDG